MSYLTLVIKLAKIEKKKMLNEKEIDQLRYLNSTKLVLSTFKIVVMNKSQSLWAQMEHFFA